MARTGWPANTWFRHRCGYAQVGISRPSLKFRSAVDVHPWYVVALLPSYAGRLLAEYDTNQIPDEFIKFEIMLDAPFCCKCI
jgi:hypothetical protein